MISAILLCGGVGSRLGNGVPKQFRLLNGKPVAQYSLDFLNQCDEIDEIIIVADPAYQSLFSSSPKPVFFALPGKRRQDSVYQGLLATSPQSDLICVHDSARPFVPKKSFQDLIDTALLHHAAALAIPITNTIKQADATLTVSRTLPREELWELQTPQMILRSLFFEAFAHAQKNNLSVTDDIALVESLGKKTVLVKSSERNFKITTPIDWLLAEKLCALN